MDIEIVILGLEIVLALIFLYFGLSKMLLPIEKIAEKVTWANDYTPARLKLFGFLEVIGAIGLVLPHQLNFFPLLTPMAATGLAMIMSGAIVVHLSRDEIKMIFLNIVMIFLLAGVGFHSLLYALGEGIWVQ